MIGITVVTFIAGIAGGGAKFIAGGGAKAVDLGEIGRDDFLDRVAEQIDIATA